MPGISKPQMRALAILSKKDEWLDEGLLLSRIKKISDKDFLFMVESKFVKQEVKTTLSEDETQLFIYPKYKITGYGMSVLENAKSEHRNMRTVTALSIISIIISVGMAIIEIIRTTIGI